MIVGLIGYAGAGKDTVADIMMKNADFFRVAFADKIKAILSELYSVPIDVFNDRVLKNAPMLVFNGKTPRQVAQETGMFYRGIRESTWLDYVKKKAGFLAGQGDNVVITDIRFPDEMDAVLSMGGVTVYIERANHEVYEHESERHIHDLSLRADYRICNNSDLSGLEFETKAVLNALPQKTESRLRAVG